SPPPVPVVTTNVVSVTSFSSGDTTPSTSVAPVSSTPVTRSRIVASAPNGLPPPSNSTQKQQQQQQQTTLLSSNRPHSSTQFANAALPPIPPQKSSHVVSFNAEASTCSQSTASALTSEDTSVISPLRQLRSQAGSAGSVAHSFHTRPTQPAVPPPPVVDQQSNGRLPPPVPPKPKNKMNQSAPRTEQLRARSKDEIVSSAAKSPLFSRILPNEEVIKF
ncbi:unnamed protein product, partial [Anisakis simplex]|uniref:WH2 domain-containing protein n=1 Tax=Anisakis simplex TaxID=6269 RepID=A0A0M3KHT2_ANISI